MRFLRHSPSDPLRLFVSICLCASAAVAQNANSVEGSAGGYAGISLRVPGIYLTPIPNAPFSATEHLITHQKTADGTDRVLQTTTHIARASSGLTYTERRRLLPLDANREPALVEGQIYDPTTQRTTLYDPANHIARQATLTRPRPLSPGPTGVSARSRPGIVETDLGTQTIEGVELRGLRRVRTLPATASGTDTEISLTDEYWYSPQLAIYVMLRHEDPRSGEQLITLSDISRTEPDNTRFRVPDAYRIVDETPPSAPVAPR